LKHLYWGDGKGKTTAAMGLALRALAAGQRVTIVQFLKNGDSGEITMLKRLGAAVYSGKGVTKFVSQMTDEERAAAIEIQNYNLRRGLAEKADMLILDEICAAWNYGMADKSKLRTAVEDAPENQEVVMTGRDPADWMRAAADYDTEMKCHRHPYQRGVTARKGVEL
jgi:cob(I)alamin adenosyltransferase